LIFLEITKMSSNTRKTTLTEDIRAWLTAIVVCLGLMLGFASTGYGDIILGNWENTMDGWAANDATVAEPCLGIGNTLGSYSLKVAVPSGWHSAVSRNSGLLPAIETATTIQVDVTLKASEWVLGSGWVKAMENLVLQDDMSSWQQLSPVGGDSAVGWDGNDRTFTVTFNIPAQTGPFTYATLIIITNYDGVTTAGNFYFDNMRIVTPSMAISKCTVTAGKTQYADDNDFNDMKDTFTTSGTFVPPADVIDVNTVGVKITSVTDDYLVYAKDLNDFNATVVNSKHKYTHTGKLIKGKAGTITSLTLDFRQGKFAITAKNIDLTGLASPLELKLTIGDNELSSQADETIINGPKTTIPTRLMRMYKDTLVVNKAKAKHNSKKASDTLSVTGDIAVKDMDIDTNEPNLVTEDVVLTWGDINGTPTKTLTIPGNASPALASFKASKKGHVYKCSKIHPAEDTNSLVAAQFDLDQCTFTVSVSKASSVFAGPADANFGVSFGTFNETADVNSVTHRSW